MAPIPTSTDPLLTNPTKTGVDPASKPLSSTTRTAIFTLHYIRIATGAACLIAPRYTCALFKYNVPTESALLVRMFGVRDAVFGELLTTAIDEKRSDGGRR